MRAFVVERLDAAARRRRGRHRRGALQAAAEHGRRPLPRRAGGRAATASTPGPHAIVVGQLGRVTIGGAAERDRRDDGLLLRADRAAPGRARRRHRLAPRRRRRRGRRRRDPARSSATSSRSSPAATTPPPGCSAARCSCSRPTATSARLLLDDPALVAGRGRGAPAADLAGAGPGPHHHPRRRAARHRRSPPAAGCCCCYGAANRDPRRYGPDADELDVRRQPRPAADLQPGQPPLPRRRRRAAAGAGRARGAARRAAPTSPSTSTRSTWAPGPTSGDPRRSRSVAGRDDGP